MSFRLEAHSEPLPGYKLIERLGGGGFGEVWKCEAPGGLQKAIKFVYGTVGQSATDSGERAAQELKALARVKEVRHPYILSLERYDVIDDQLLIVMELADRNLWDRFKECREQGNRGIPREELLSYMKESAEALDLMNLQYQLQHLDIKPQNLFLVHQHVKVADFGLAKDLENSQAMMTGGVTPVYAAPETFDGWVSRYSDQYSLAIVYQELLTGKRPFAGNNVRNLIMQHLEADPDLAPLPEADRPIIFRALAKQANDRFPSCQEMVNALIRATSAEPRKTIQTGADSSHHGTTTAEVLTPPPSPAESVPVPLQDPHLPITQESFRAPKTESFQAISSQQAQRPESSVSISEEEGVLVPTLVLGLGGLGIATLEQCYEALGEHFESMDAIPHIRLLGIDSDPETVKRLNELSKNQQQDKNGFPPQQVVTSGLQRPASYLQPRDNKPAVDTWLSQKMLYRIPRDHQTRGVRALGRLAFVDNYRTIVRRFQTELQAMLAPEALERAEQVTQLKFLSTEPRIYLLSSLCGGAGSGMLLDVAYVLRRLLREMGIESPDVHGLFLMPGIESVSQSRSGSSHIAAKLTPVSMGNTCATLTELYHYMLPDTKFQARYSNQETGLNDTAAPVEKCYLFPLPPENKKEDTQQQLIICAEFLTRQMCTGIGRALAQSPDREQRGLDPTYRTVGSFQVTFPRTKIIQRVSKRLCQQVVEGWMSKDGKRVKLGVAQYVEGRWPAEKMNAPRFIEMISERIEYQLQKDAVHVMEELMTPLTRMLAEVSGSSQRRSPLTLSTELLRGVVRSLEGFIGSPKDNSAGLPGEFEESAKAAGKRLTEKWGEKLSAVAVKLIEKPQFRLAGAEEGIRHVSAILAETLGQLEKMLEERREYMNQYHSRIQSLLKKLKDIPQWEMEAVEQLQKLVDLIRNFGKSRIQTVILEQACSTVISLKGNLSEELSEINFCRARLKDLHQTFVDPVTSPSQLGIHTIASALEMNSESCRRYLLPEGCSGLAEATDQILAALTPEDLLTLEERIQKMIRSQYRALIEICLGSQQVTTQVAGSLQRVVKDFLNHWMHHADITDLFLAQYPEAEQLEHQLLDAFEEAMPEPVSRFTSEMKEHSILATPKGANSDYLRSMAEHCLKDLQGATPALGNELLIYREWSKLPILELEQLGAVGQEAYRQLLQLDHFTPHSRMDVAFQVPVDSDH